MNSDLLDPTSPSLVACHDCDLLQRPVPLHAREVARCARCGAELYRHSHNSVERTLLLSLAALVCFLLANSFPFLTMAMQDRTQQAHLITGIVELFRYDMPILGSLVFLLTILLPLLKILSTLYVMTAVHYQRRLPQVIPVFRALKTIGPWSMTEVYMLGVLIAYAKLQQTWEMIPGIALYSFTALIVLMTAASTTLSAREVWTRLERQQ